MSKNTDISNAMNIHLGEIFKNLPEMPNFVNGIRRSPARHFNLSQKDTELALKNALRYVPEDWHATLAPELLDELLPRNVYVQLYRALLETSTSEHAARMAAMDNATTACKDMIDGLTLAYNKARQAAITAELMDIVGGAEALKG